MVWAVLLEAMGGAAVGGWISVGIQSVICRGHPAMCWLGFGITLPIFCAAGLIAGGVFAAKKPAWRSALRVLLITDVVLFAGLIAVVMLIFGSPF